MTRELRAMSVLVASNPVWETALLVASLPELDALQVLGLEAMAAHALASRCDGGGSALNTACALAFLGYRALAVGRVGDDDEGRAALQALTVRGVEARISAVAGRRTKSTAVARQRGSDRSAFGLWVPPRAVSPLDAAAVAPELLLSARLLHLDRASEAALAWVARREREGLPTSFDLHTVPHRAPARERAIALLRRVQIAQLRGDAADALGAALGEVPGTPQALLAALSGALRWLVVTRGAEGAIGAEAGGHDVPMAAVPVTGYVDSTGAGDAFAAELLAGWLEGRSLNDAMVRGLQSAAEACTWLGARRPVASTIS